MKTKCGWCGQECEKKFCDRFCSRAYDDCPTNSFSYNVAVEAKKKNCVERREIAEEKRRIKRTRNNDPVRNAAIVEMYLKTSASMEKIGDRFGITRERVRQLLPHGASRERKERIRNNVLSYPLHMSRSEVEKTSGISAAVIDRIRKDAGVEYDYYNARRRKFLGLVEKDAFGCHMFTGYTDPSGYGIFHFSGVRRYAHRLAWEFVNGETESGLHVLHKCDNPACVNIDHLFIGTHADNMADRNAKGRQARGESMGPSKLTEAQVIEARQTKRNNPDMSIPDIHTMLGYDIGLSGLWYAISGRTWAHVPGAVK